MKNILLALFLITSTAHGALTRTTHTMVSGNVAVRYSMSTTQSIPTASATTLNFDQEVIDTCTPKCVTTGAGVWKFAPFKAGVYLVSVFIQFTPNATGTRELYLGAGSSIGTASQFCIDMASMSPNASNNFALKCTTTVRLNATDIITSSAYQNTGSALSLTTASITRNFIDIVRIAD